MQKTFAIIGSPLPPVFLPDMFQAAFKAEGIKAKIQMFELNQENQEELENFCYEADYRGIKGFAVWPPFRQQIVRLMDYYDPLAKRIGSVDTVMIEGSNLIGYNCTHSAILDTLKEKIDPKGKKALLLGAGATARAAGHCLKEAGAKVFVFGRDAHQSEQLANDFELETVEYRQIKGAGFDLIVNATPVGAPPREEESLLRAEQIPQSSVVMEVIVNPLETQLIKEAKKAKAQTITGERLLLHLAAEQLRLWTGKTADLEAMEGVMKKSL